MNVMRLVGRFVAIKGECSGYQQAPNSCLQVFERLLCGQWNRLCVFLQKEKLKRGKIETSEKKICQIGLRKDGIPEEESSQW